MDLERAVAILRDSEGSGYIAWDDESKQPLVRDGAVTLDGSFTYEELLALAACVHLARGEVRNCTSAACKKDS